MYESYQDHSHEHNSYARAIAITFLIALVLVVGICLLIRAVGKPNQSSDPAASVSSGIVYDDAALEAAGRTSARRRSRLPSMRRWPRG